MPRFQVLAGHVGVMLDLRKLILEVRLHHVERIDIELRNVLMEFFERGLRVQRFLIVCVSPVRYTGSI